MISILCCSRKQDYENIGTITNFVRDLATHTFDKKSIEIIFKLDTDDYENIQEYLDLGVKENFFDINCKAVISDRCYYHGIRHGTKECFAITNPNSKVMISIADDHKIDMQNWDLEILEKCKHFTKEDIFIVQSSHDRNGNLFNLKQPDIGLCPEIIMWSRKIVEIFDGFGGMEELKTATDHLSISISSVIYKVKPQNILFLPREIANRLLCPLDSEKIGGLNNRYHTDRKNIIDSYKSDQYNKYVSSKLNQIVSLLQKD